MNLVAKAMASRFRRKAVCTAATIGTFCRCLGLALVVGLFLLAALGVRAQSVNDGAGADDFFNSGAQFYVSNNIPDALKRVETGLKIYPQDAKLKKLEELLKQQQRQQQQQQQQNQQKNQQNGQNQSQNQQQNGQQPQNSQQNPRNSAQPQQNQQNQQKQANSQKQQEKQAQQAQAMTPEEAKRLLDAQKGNEQLLKFNSQNQPQNANPPIKDW
jgi:Ca-activated chloride channel homolog